jgi:hypothetical protein
MAAKGHVTGNAPLLDGEAGGQVLGKQKIGG